MDMVPIRETAVAPLKVTPLLLVMYLSYHLLTDVTLCASTARRLSLWRKAITDQHNRENQVANCLST
jgi:hypothetical protein